MTTEPRPTMQHGHTAPAETDRLGMTVLADQECWDRLRDEPVGRLAVVVRGRPHLVPVNHLVRDREILFASVPGTKLEEALNRPGVPAAFEVDAYDRDTHSGWSVVATGHLHPVMDLIEHTSLDLRGRPIWLEGYRDRNWLRLAVDQVVGRRLESTTDDVT